MPPQCEVGSGALRVGTKTLYGLTTHLALLLLGLCIVFVCLLCQPNSLEDGHQGVGPRLDPKTTLDNRGMFVLLIYTIIALK